MHNKKPDGTLDDEEFYTFLGRITAFVWASTVVDSIGISKVRAILFREMINIVQGKAVTFAEYKFDIVDLKRHLQRYQFSGKKKITRSMLAWWAMANKQQVLLSLTTPFETEHISKKTKTLNPEAYEHLGNKSLLEGKIKSASACFSFAEKKKYYLGQVSTRQLRTQIHELQEIAVTSDSFSVKDINQRNKRIIESFLDFVIENQLTK